jgi:hypothetical protein
MLVVDCDTKVVKTGISYLVTQLQHDPKLIGVCRYAGVGNLASSFVVISQVFEYWLTHAVLKAVDSMCTNVLVLSGCFTIYQLKLPNNRLAILHPLLLEDYTGTYGKVLHEHNLLSIGEYLISGLIADCCISQLRPAPPQSPTTFPCFLTGDADGRIPASTTTFLISISFLLKHRHRALFIRSLLLALSSLWCLSYHLLCHPVLSL